jgi:cell division protein FtsL
MNRQLTASLLLVCAVASSLWWVYTLHQSRSLFLQLEQLSTQHDEAMAEWSRLQIEQATFADASRVEQIARDRLNMIVPEKLEILVIEQ